MTARSLCRYEAVKCKYVEIGCVGVVSEESPDVKSHQSLTDRQQPNQFDQDLNN